MAYPNQTYPDAFLLAVLKVYPNARITNVGPLIVSCAIPAGKDKQRTIARYSVKRGTWEIK